MAVGKFETLTPHFLPADSCFSQQPTGRSHKCIFSPVLFIFVKGNMAVAEIPAKLVGGHDSHPCTLYATAVWLP